MLNFTRLDDIRAQRPLIHCVCNFVTANDCANLALAVGASPIMAHAPEEMQEITAFSAATVLNTGTPDTAGLDTCLLCGRAAVEKHQPVVLDPVGVGASSWRLRRIEELLAAFTPSILRVNLSEALSLLHVNGREHGVDSLGGICTQERMKCAKVLAARLHTVVLLSGPEDVVTDGSAALLVPGGSSRMTGITGAGCMLSVLCGAFAAVEPDGLAAAALASVFWKTCARRAEEQAGRIGTGSFHTALLDAASTLAAPDLSQEAEILQGA